MSCSPFLLASAPLAALIVLGCDGGNVAPPFPEGQGQLPSTGLPYPPGPYAISVGQVIENYKLAGFPDPSAENATEVPIELAMFYNPTGEGLYAEESPFAGQTLPLVLWLNVSASWCGPCQLEASEILPHEYDLYAPQGAQFLLQLADGPTPGIPALLSHLTEWTTRYDTRWPATIDPAYKIGAQFAGAAYPVNILIDTKTMKVLEVAAGIPEEGSAFFQTLEQTLGG